MTRVEPIAGDSDLELRDYLRVLRRRAWVVVVAILVAVVGAVAMSNIKTPMYAATSELVLETHGADIINSVSGQRIDPVRLVQTEVRVIESRPVRDRVLAELPDAPPVMASAEGQTDILSLRVESRDPVLAKAAANAYARAYISQRREGDVAQLTAAITELERTVADIDAQIAAAREGERPALQRARDSLLETRQDLVFSSRLKTGGARINQEALVPTEPFSPRPVRNAILAFMIGGILGVGLAFLIEYLDDSIKTKEDLERASGLPVVGMIPAEGGPKDPAVPVVASIEYPTSSAAEAYRTLRTAVQFMSFDKPVRVIQVTSPSAAEGKTTTVANLGVALARAGKHVTVVCCDLRRPRLHRFFGFDNKVGLTSLLLRDATLSDALQPVVDFPRLTVLASGPVPPNPSELLASKRAVEVLHPLTDDERIVLIDSPPVLPVTDALVISRWVDATLMVCSARETKRGELHRAIEMLERVGAPVVGTVLNGVRRDTRYGYGYKYHYRPYSLDGDDLAPNGNGSRTDKRRRSKKVSRR